MLKGRFWDRRVAINLGGTSAKGKLEEGRDLYKS